MRVNTEHSYVNRSNTSVQSVRMSFDENSVGFLMDVMTNLYSDTVMAPIREYSSNALDSHNDAGVTRPVEVTLPTEFNPTFEVKDFGVGMSPDDITNIYSKYGYSTKRQSDEVVGMLGLGSKSGLTYADQFSVIAVKNGVKTMATVARGKDGAGTINILDTSSTDEPNGVTIQIPVHEVQTFRNKALSFFRWWEPGTVLVDGEEPERPKTHVLEVEDDISIHGNLSSVKSDYIVMGCIAYNVGGRLSEGLPFGYNVVAYVPMGAVNFPPNREGLQYTRRTQAVLDDIITRRKEGVRKAAEKDIEQAKTHAEAIRVRKTWERLLLKKVPQYKGLDIPTYIKAKDGEGFFVYEPNRYRGSVSRLTSISAEQFVNYMVIKDFSNKELSSHNRHKIRLYVEQNGLNFNSFIITKDLFGHPWIDDSNVYSWEDIKKTRINSTRSGTSSAPVFCVQTLNGGREYVSKVEGDDIILASPSTVNPKRKESVRADAIASLFPDSVILFLARNRWAKFKRDHKESSSTVRTLEEAVKQRISDFDKTLSDFEYMNLRGQGYKYRAFEKLVPEEIEDPEVSSLVKGLQTTSSRQAEWNKIFAVCRELGIYEDLKERNVNFDHIFDKYPLAQYTVLSNREHMHYYINLLYREQKGNS